MPIEEAQSGKSVKPGCDVCDMHMHCEVFNIE